MDEEKVWREWKEDAAQNPERVDEAEEEDDARSYASARSGSSYSYSSSDSSSGGEDRTGAAAKETVPQQSAARSIEIRQAAGQPQMLHLTVPAMKSNRKRMHCPH